MADNIKVFNNPFANTETWSAQGALLTWNVGSASKLLESKDISRAVPLLLQTVQLQYSQPVQAMYPINAQGLNKAVRINMKGAPNGVLSFNSIYSPMHTDIKEFLEAASRGCSLQGQELYVVIHPFGNIECSGISQSRGQENDPRAGINKHKNDISFLLKGVVLTSMGLNIEGNELTVVNMPLQFMFTSMEYNVLDKDTSSYGLNGNSYIVS
jgi:hypothetical protein